MDAIYTEVQSEVKIQRVLSITITHLQFHVYNRDFEILGSSKINNNSILHNFNPNNRLFLDLYYGYSLI